MGKFKYVDSVRTAHSTNVPVSTAVRSDSYSTLSAPIFTVSDSGNTVSGEHISSNRNEETDNEKKTDKFIPANYVVDSIEDAYDAMYCAGTKDKQLEQALENLNENNIIEFLCGWNKYHSAEKGESFMKAFMWDADSEQKVKYGRKIKNLLVRRAEKAGIYDKLAEKFGEIDSELSSTFYVNNSICDTYDEIIRDIAKAENNEYGTPQSCHDGMAGAMETCKEYGLLGNTVAVVCGTVYGIVKGIVDLFV